MELSIEILGALSLAGDSFRLPDICFEKLVNYAIVGVMRPEECSSFIADDKVFREVDQGVLKQSFFGLVSLFIECSKHGIVGDSLQSVFDDCKISADRAAVMTKAYQDNSLQMSNYLKKRSIVLGSLLRRNDLIVPYSASCLGRSTFRKNSNHLEKINEATYIVSLSTERGNSESSKNVVFTCTVEQLQDLVSKLKDAVKCFERLSQR